MESRNPVFNRSGDFKRGGYATFDTAAPTATELETMYGARRRRRCRRAG
jgi:hypothetical protein